MPGTWGVFLQNRDSIDAVLEASQRCWDLAGQLMNAAAAALDLWAIAEEAEYALLFGNHSRKR